MQDVNSAQFLAAVGAAAAAAGLRFEVFRYENATASARSFAAAAVVVAPHGGALANLIFCEPGTAVVEIVPETNVRLFYGGLAYARGLRYFAVPAVEFAGYDRGDIVVDAERLAGVVREALDEGVLSML